MYLAVVLDAWSRKIVGWPMANHLRAELVVDALDMALGQRRPAGGVIVHSDQGSQYASVAFGKRCKEAGVRPSMGSVGDACDNAMCESFFATLECELLDRRRFASQAEARVACFSFIEECCLLQLHRGMAQPRPPALRAELPLAHPLRARHANRHCCRPSPETVHENGATSRLTAWSSSQRSQGQLRRCPPPGAPGRQTNPTAPSDQPIAPQPRQPRRQGTSPRPKALD